MKQRLTVVLVALGFSTAAFAGQYDEIASGSALPPGESAYGYALSDPYTEEYLVVPSDTVVLIPLDEDDVPG